MAWSRRAALASDADAVLALRDAALRDVVDPGADATDGGARDRFVPADWVIVEGDPSLPHGIAAAIRVERRRHEIFVHDLVVAPAERGKGLATAALRELIDEAVRNDVSVATLVPPRATRALRLLKFLGFVVVPSPVPGRSRLVWRA